MIYTKDKIDMSLVQCPYEEERGYIYIADDYTNNILKLSGYSDIDDDDYQYLCKCDILADFLYEYTLKSASNAYNYAHHILGSVFPLGEEIIATNALYAYHYALGVIKGRFELGEPVIVTDSCYSFLYARDILNGKFELGEPVIATDSYFSHRYAGEVLKGRFELGEKLIATDSYFSYYYAKNYT